MYWQYTPYVWIYAVASMFGFAMGAYAWKHRSIPGATPFAIVQFSAALWSIANALESSRTDLPSILFFSNIAFIGIVPLAPASLGIALQYTGRNQWLSRRHRHTAGCLSNWGCLDKTGCHCPERRRKQSRD